MNSVYRNFSEKNGIAIIDHNWRWGVGAGYGARASIMTLITAANLYRFYDAVQRNPLDINL